MIKQKQFSFKRFGLLLKRHTAENYKGYLMSVFVLLSILTATIIITNFNKKDPMPFKEQCMYFMFFLLATGTIFTSNMFANMGDKRKAISALMLPASSFEKFLVGWLYSYVIFQALFIAVYYLLLVGILNLGLWPGHTVHILNVFTDEPVCYVFIAYAILHAFMLYGAIYFKKMHFIKTAFSVFAIAAIVCFINIKIVGLMIPNAVPHNMPFMSVLIDTKNDQVSLQQPPNTNYLIALMFLLMSVIIWVAAYFRLKEKQI